MIYLMLYNILYKLKKVCKLWDLNPRVLSTNDLESLPLDRSGKLAIKFFYNYYVYIILNVNINN